MIERTEAWGHGGMEAGGMEAWDEAWRHGSGEAGTDDQANREQANRRTNDLKNANCELRTANWELGTANFGIINHNEF